MGNVSSPQTPLLVCGGCLWNQSSVERCMHFWHVSSPLRPPPLVRTWKHLGQSNEKACGRLVDAAKAASVLVDFNLNVPRPIRPLGIHLSVHRRCRIREAGWTIQDPRPCPRSFGPSTPPFNTTSAGIPSAATNFSVCRTSFSFWFKRHTDQNFSSKNK